MILAATLFLAQAFYIEKMEGTPESYYVRPQPNFMPVNTPVVPPAARIVDNVTLGNPAFQRQEYEFPSEENGYGYREVIPRNQRNYVPIQERIAMEEIETGRANDQARLAAQQFNLSNARANAEYDANINSQATLATQRLGTLDPKSDDFPAQLAQFQEEFPLAFQNPGFNQTVGRLNNSYEQRKQAQEVLNRQVQSDIRDEDKFQTQLTTRLRSQVAALGQDYLDELDKQVAEGADPIVAYSAVAQRANRAQAAYEAEQKRLERENQPLSQSDYLGNIRAISSIQKSVNDGSMTEEEAAPQIQALRQQNRTYETQRGLTTSRDTQPSAPVANPTLESIQEGQIVTQNGRRFRKTNGQFVLIQ